MIRRARLRVELIGAAALIGLCYAYRSAVYAIDGRHAVGRIAVHWLPGYLDVFGTRHRARGDQRVRGPARARRPLVEWIGRRVVALVGARGRVLLGRRAASRPAAEPAAAEHAHRMAGRQAADPPGRCSRASPACPRSSGRRTAGSCAGSSSGVRSRTPASCRTASTCGTKVGSRSGWCGPTGPTSVHLLATGHRMSSSTYPLILTAHRAGEHRRRDRELLPRRTTGDAAQGPPAAPARAAPLDRHRARPRRGRCRRVTVTAEPRTRRDPRVQLPLLRRVARDRGDERDPRARRLRERRRVREARRVVRAARGPARDRARDLLHDLGVPALPRVLRGRVRRAAPRRARAGSSAAGRCASCRPTGSRSPPSCSSTTRRRSRPSPEAGGGFSSFTAAQLVSLYSLTQIYSRALVLRRA